MDNRIRRLYESIAEHGGCKGYFFHFENMDSKNIALVSWCVNPKTGYQSFALEIEDGEPEQLRDLLNTYLSAKQFAECFDLRTITFLFEQYAENEDIEIICE